MIEEQFVPLNLALRLKKLNFNEVCLASYNKDGELNEISKWYPDLHYLQEHPNICLAPLWQQAFDWFREKYRLHSEISVYPKGFSYRYQNYYDNIDEGFDLAAFTGKIYYFETYGEARQTCLEELIKLVENEKS